jgi:hypothetical protein
MEIERSSWSASAAYLYVLGLDNVSLAWEYLRRNISYQANWRDLAARSDSSSAVRWGLRYLEDPRRDARAAEPLWRPLPPSCVHLMRHYISCLTMSCHTLKPLILRPVRGAQ